MKKVVVIGGSGFIGQYFCAALLEKGYNVVGTTLGNEKKKAIIDELQGFLFTSLDVLDYEALMTITKGVDLVINCAALDGNSAFKAAHSAQILDTNMRISSNILNAALENKIGQVILLSSAEVYPTTATSPIKETDDYKKSFEFSQNGYVLSKRFSEILGEQYTQQYGLNVFFPRLTNVYGPGDNFDPSSPRVIPSMISRVLNKEKVEIWGDGSQVRSFIYVDDAVNAVIEASENNPPLFLNIATPETITLLNLAKLIGTLCKQKISPTFNTSKPGGMPDRSLDVTQLQKLVTSKSLTLEQGLAKTISWYTKTQVNG
jgi:nucleoside-diphosphate-sugar epimerase